MNGARCKETKDGTDYCMKCIVDKLAKYKPKIYCLCGNYLVLGNGHDVKDIFNKKENYKMEKEDSSSLETDDVSLCSPSTPNCAKSVSPPNSTRCIKRANTYRCAWCLTKFETKNESLYYCTEQSIECCRIIKNHFIQFQPFVVCVGCVAQSDVKYIAFSFCL